MPRLPRDVPRPTYAVDVHEDADPLLRQCRVARLYPQDGVDITLEDGYKPYRSMRNAKDEKTTPQGNGKRDKQPLRIKRCRWTHGSNVRSHSPPPSMKAPCRQR